MPAFFFCQSKKRLLFLFYALLGFSLVMGQDCPLEIGVDQVVPFKLYKTTYDTISGSSLMGLDYLEPSKFDKTDPRDTYVARLDFDQYAPLLEEENSQWILQIGYLNRAKLFYWNGNALDSVTMGSFELNSRFTGKFSFDKKKLVGDRYLYLKFSKLNRRQRLSDDRFVFYSQAYDEYWGGISTKKPSRYFHWAICFGGPYLSGQ